MKRDWPNTLILTSTFLLICFEEFPPNSIIEKEPSKNWMALLTFFYY